MKSLIVNPPHNFEMVEKEMPKATDGRVVLKTKYVAICGSDNMLWKTAQGMSLGHEFSGYIEDPGTFPFKKGARVCAAEFNPCGKCKFCQNGQEQLCKQMMVDNPGVTMDGAFSEYVSVRGDLSVSFRMMFLWNWVLLRNLWQFPFMGLNIATSSREILFSSGVMGLSASMQRPVPKSLVPGKYIW